MVKRSTPAHRKRRKPPTRPTKRQAREPESAAIDALFDAFAQNLARKLAAKAKRRQSAGPATVKRGEGG